jgi:hypothetical protein
MNYFTADLLLRFGSDDPAVAEAASEEWERACERYNAHIAALKPQMTPGLLQIEENYCLHDAKVRGMGRQGPSFVIMLQLDTSPHSLLTFTADLTAEPAINTTALPRELRSTGETVEWQYDELELVPGTPATWSWVILLSNGWEVRLCFRDIHVQEAQALIPSPRNGPLSVASVVAQPA